MTSLKENGLYDDTIIIFTSEHGEMMGDHGMLEKRTLYEESAKVPLLVKLNGKLRQISSSKFLGDLKKVTVLHIFVVLSCSFFHKVRVPTVFSGEI